MIPQMIVSILLIAFSLGVVLAKKPVYSCLSFLVTLILLATMYLQLYAEFIASMQVLVYAGAILVLFMIVMILFQDAHQKMESYEPQSNQLLIFLAVWFFLSALVVFARVFVGWVPLTEELSPGFGSVESLGKLLYIDFFFPFEAVILLFLISIIGAFYIGKFEKVKT